MPRVAKKSQKKNEIKESKKYTNMLEAYSAFWRRGFTEWAGTSSRSEYWWSYLMTWLIAALLAVLIIISTLSYSSLETEIVFSPMSVILSFGLILFLLASLIPSISMTARRLHDAGLSAWWLLLLLLNLICEPISIIISIVFFIFAVLPTKVEGNPYHKFNK